MQNSEDIMEDFCKLAELNAKSVAIQYDNEIVGIEDNLYNTEFLQYKMYAKKVIQKGYHLFVKNTKKELQCAIYSVIKFFNSIFYQMEIDFCIEQANKILLPYYKQLYSVLRVLDDVNDEELDTWGVFDIFDNVNFN